MGREKSVILHLAEKHKRKLTEGLSASEFLQLNFTKLNRKAMKIAKVELRAIQKKQMVKI